MSLNGRQILTPRQWLLAACVALLVLPAWGRADDAPPTARDEIAKLAKGILKTVEDEGQSTIAVGAFTGPAQFDTNAGPGFQELLCEELEKQKKGVVQQ